jgi:aminoglycoside phosphotransferase (APT) family kinase protein
MAGDEPRAVRDEEALDTAVLGAWIDERLGGVRPIEVLQFPGGHSNLTYLIKRGGDELVLRRPPFGSKVKSAHDMGREFAVLSKLAPVFAKAPRPIAMCEDEGVIGARFYLMERRRGVILRKEVPPGFTAEQARRVCELTIDTLAELHAIDYAAAGLGEFGKPLGYIERQVKGWTERYAGAKTDEIPAVDEVAAWLEAHRPADGKPSLIHNDFKFDNLILDEDLTRVTGILDWEMSTIGDPLMDLGTSLSYWIEASDPQPLQMGRFVATNAPGMLTRRDVIARYAAASGRALDDAGALFYYAYGLFKTAVVGQQIYYRYAKGLTRDPRFAMIVHGVRFLAEQAQHAIAAGRV